MPRARASCSGRRRSRPQGVAARADRGGRRLGTLYLREGAGSSLAIRRRFLPALASLVAVAIDRERLAREAVEAEALRRSDTIKTAVLQAVSHDLRSPLTAIKVAAESLANPALALDEGDRDGTAGDGAARGDRLERVVGNLLDLSRLQAGRRRAAARALGARRAPRRRRSSSSVLRGRPSRARPPGGHPGRRGRCGPDRARPRQPARERAEVLARPTRRFTCA